MNELDLDKIKKVLDLKNSGKTTNRLSVDQPIGYELEEGIRSRERVVDLAEVFTPNWLVVEMLESIPGPDLGIETRVLEPSCGNGNFLVEILARKLQQITLGTSIEEIDFQIVKSLATTYGVDISIENIQEAVSRITELVNSFYAKYVKASFSLEMQDVISYILERNIVHADFLKNLDFLEIYEFSFPKKYYVSRRVFTLIELIELNSNDFVLPRPERVLETLHYLELK